jgi:hypothetical protein
MHRCLKPTATISDARMLSYGPFTFNATVPTLSDRGYNKIRKTRLVTVIVEVLGYRRLGIRQQTYAHSL